MFHRSSRLIGILVLLSGVVTVQGCAGKRTLTDTERTELRNQPAIQVVHYATPTPSVSAPKTNTAPTGGEIQNNLDGYDPTLDLSRRFSGMLARSAGLKNLRIERNTTPLPPANDAKGFQTRYKNGAVLEVWVDGWGFNHIPADPKTYSLTFNAKSRLTRMQDGKVLWSGGSCSYVSNGKNTNDRVALADLKSKDGKKAQAKFRQVMGQVTDNCAQQLLREFSKKN